VQALGGPDRTLTADELEVALLSRSNGRRAFRRLDDDRVLAALSAAPAPIPAEPAPPSATPADPATEGGGSAPVG